MTKHGYSADGEPAKPHEQSDESGGAIFVASRPHYNRPGRVVTLGHYYPHSRVEAAKDLLRETKSGYDLYFPVKFGRLMYR
jgi:hypothetical protein